MIHHPAWLIDAGLIYLWWSLRRDYRKLNRR